MSEIRAVLNNDQTIKAVLNNDATVKAVLLSGVTVNQKIDGGEYIHFNVTNNGNNQQFSASALNQYIANTNINLFKNGVYVPPVDFIKVGNTTIQVNIPLATGDGLDILATGSAAISPVGNSTPGGINQQIQFNNGGILAGASGITYNTFTNTTTISTGNVNQLNANTANIGVLNVTTFNLPNVTSNNANFTSLVVTGTSNLTNVNVSGTLNVTGTFSPSSLTVPTLNTTTVTANGVVTLGTVSNVKITGGTNGFVLQTDGAGNLSWTAQTGGGGGNGVPGGSNSQVQFNDGGSFGGDSGFTYVKSTDSLTVTGNVIAGNLKTNNLQYANGSPYQFTSNAGGTNTQVQFNDGNIFGGDSGFTYTKTTDTLTVSGNIVAGNLKTNNLQYANGNPYQFTTNAGGTNTQVQFNDGNIFAGSSNFTFNKTTNTLNATNINGTLTTSSQPNITSLGTLSSLNVSGAITAGSITGSIANANYASFAGNIVTASQPNITSLGTLTSLSVSGAITATTVTGTHIGSATGIYNIPGANVTGTVANATYATSAGTAGSATSAGVAASATTAGTVTSNSQGNITSLGTLTSLNVTNVGAVGTIRTDNIQYANGANWIFSTYSNTNVANFLPTYTGTFSPGNTTLTIGSARSIQEPVTIVNTSPSSTQNIDIASGTATYFTTNTLQNTILNVRGNSTTTLNAYMATGQSITFSTILTNPSTIGGATYYITQVNIDGTSQTVRWLSGIPTSSLGGLDVYVFTIIKTGINSYTVIGNKGNAQ